MNYRHIYHAGGFADVFKHYVLTLILEKLSQKETPFSVIDTHAGIGLYDLTSPLPQKTLEYKLGIEKLLHSREHLKIFESYLQIIHSFNPKLSEGILNFYPGSPLIIRSFMKNKNKLFLSELHPDDYETLKSHFYNDSFVHVFNQDFMITLKSLLPPNPRRGLILIDPPFEKTDEFDQILKGLKEAHRRFSNGIYAVWYPFKDKTIIQKFHQNLKNLNISKILSIDFLIRSPIEVDRLNGCGMILINPPWEIERVLTDSLPLLLHYLGFGDHGRVVIQRLVEE